jgi:hypothetical protein
MDPIVLLILLIIIFGIGGPAWYGPQAQWSPSYYGGSTLLVVLIILAILMFAGRIPLGRVH